MVNRVVGIDLSLTCTGVGRIDQPTSTPPVAHATSFTTKGRRADALPDRHERIAGIAREVLLQCVGARLAVIESPSFGSSNAASPLDRYGLWWMIVGDLMRAEVPVATISPASVKLAITGSGRADKAAVAIAVERLWPGMDVSSSDVSDAIGLAHLGAVWLGWDVPTLERHRQVKAAWPVLPDFREEAS